MKEKKSKATISSSESDSDDEPLIKIAKRSGSQLSMTSQVSPASNTSSSITDKLAGSASSSKPLTAFAHFFNDTQHTIRNQNPAATFDGVSSIVVSMWERLEADTKLMYQKRVEEDRLRFDQSVHNIIPSLLQQADRTPSNTSTTTNTANAQPDLLQPAPPSAQEVEDQQTNDSTEVADSVAATSTSNQAIPIRKPLVVQTIPQQKKVISFGKLNNIVVTTKPVHPAPDPMTTLLNAKGISVVSKSSAKPPVKYVVTSKEISTRTGTKTVQAAPTADDKSGTSIDSDNSAVDSVGALAPASAPASYSSKSPSPQELKEDRGSSTPSPQPKTCKYSSCDKASIKHKKWDNDFCSSQCVVDHCDERFKVWVTSRS